MDVLTTRSAEIDDEYNSELNEITISFSSEHPYLRSYGYEVLSHAPADVDLSWADSGNAPFLLDHTTDDASKHIGVVTRAWLDGNKGRATIRFSGDEEKQGVINDIKAGIRPNISVGYQASDPIKIGTIEGTDTYKFKWRVSEISSVSVPADPTIGSNRSYEILPITLSTTTKDIPIMEIEQVKTQPAPDLEAIRSDAMKSAQTRAIEISNLCSQWGMAERAAEFLATEKSVLDVKGEILADVEKRSAVVIGKAPAFIASVGDASNYNGTAPFSFARAVAAMSGGSWDACARERESSQEMARSMGKRHSDNKIFLNPNQMISRAAASTTPGLGGDFVSQQFMQDRLVDVLWAKGAVAQLPVDLMLGMKANMVIPVATSRPTGTWGTEQATTPVAQGVTTSRLEMTPRILRSHATFTRLLDVQSNPSIEASTYDKLFKSIIQTFDDALFSAVNIAEAPASVLAAITQVVSSGTNGGVLTQDNIVKLIDTIEAFNLDPEAVAFITNTSVKNTLCTTLRDAANTASNYILPSFETRMLYGRPMHVSNNIPKNLTKGTHVATDLSALIAGVWSDLAVAQWGAIEVVHDANDTYNDSLIHVKAFSNWNALVKRPESFAVIKDIVTK